MDVALVSTNGLLNEFSVTVPFDVFQKIESTKVLNVSKKVKVDGFRIGKAPVSIVRAQYGDTIRADAFQSIFDEGVKKIVSENSLKPAGPAKVDIAVFESGKPIVLNYIVEVMPDIPLINTATMDLPFYEFFPSANEVEALKDRILLQFSPKISLDRPAQVGDVVSYLRSTFNHDTNEEDLDENPTHIIIREGDEESSRFIGKSKGDIFHYDETGIDGYHNNLHVRVQDVAELSEKSDVNSRIAAILGHDNGLDEVAINLSKSELDAFADRERLSSMLDTLDYRYDFPLPQVMIDAESSDIVQSEGLEDNEKIASFAKRRVKLALLFLKYGQEKNVIITNEDVAKAIAIQSGKDRKEFTRLVEIYKNNKNVALELKNQIFEQKVIDSLLQTIGGSTRFMVLQDYLNLKIGAMRNLVKN